MTRDEVLAMKPGSKLDLLVCEKVMKWKTPWEPFFPSTDIAAAWEVEAAAMEIDRLEYVAALMQVVWNDMNYIELADPDNMTAWQAIPDLLRATPEQRCKAALLAVMGE